MITDPSAQNDTTNSTQSYLPITNNSTILETFPSSLNDTDSSNSTQQFWLGTSNPDTFQIFYPGGSIAPESQQGDDEVRFTAQPPPVEKIGSDTNATLEYNVFLPETFSFAKMGTLPGLHGGGKGCCTSNGPE